MTPLEPNPFWSSDAITAGIAASVATLVMVLVHLCRNWRVYLADFRSIFQEPTPQERQEMQELAKYYPRFSRSFSEPAAKGGEWRTRIVPIDEARRRKQLDAIAKIGQGGRVA